MPDHEMSLDSPDSVNNENNKNSKCSEYGENDNCDNACSGETAASSGKAWLVGAGPGDVGLLTLRARQLIESADVVIIDRLVGHVVRALIPASSKVIYVGKNAGQHTMRHEEINKIIAHEAKKGQMVVRLKGGDPFVFGRGGEEIEELIEQGVPYEVVPGVTSPVAAAAYAGIPVTHRDHASGMHIITAHRRKGYRGGDSNTETAGRKYGGDDASAEYEKYAKLDGTFIFLMGVSSLPDICRGLLGGGMKGNTPAAVIENGTTAMQRRIDGTLETITDEVRKNGVKPPAIIIVGGVASLGKRFEWRGKLPLSGRSIIVTRPLSHQSILVEPLRALGAEVMEAPAIRIVPRAPQLFRDALVAATRARYIVFTSANGVECFFNALKANEMDIRCFAGAKIAVIGAGTEKALSSYAINADFRPEVFDARHLAEGLANICERGDTLVSFRAGEGSAALNEVFAQRGFDFLDVPVYDTLPDDRGCALIKSYAEHCLGGVLDRQLVVTLTSSSCARSTGSALGELVDSLHIVAVCIGEITALEARNCGFRNTLISREATIDSMIEAICTLRD